MDIVERIRIYEIDHAPEGWPAIKMKEVSELADEIERLRAERDQLMAQRPNCWRITHKSFCGIATDKKEIAEDKFYDGFVIPLYARPMPAQQSPAPCAMPDDVKAALADLDASFYRVWAKNLQELTGYVDPAHIVKVIEWARRNAPAATPRITERDAREIVSILLADYREEYCGQSIDSWIESCEELLLKKLNNNPTTQEEK